MKNYKGMTFTKDGFGRDKTDPVVKAKYEEIRDFWANFEWEIDPDYIVAEKQIIKDK